MLALSVSPTIITFLLSFTFVGGVLCLLIQNEWNSLLPPIESRLSSKLHIHETVPTARCHGDARLEAFHNQNFGRPPACASGQKRSAGLKLEIGTRQLRTRWNATA